MHVVTCTSQLAGALGALRASMQVGAVAGSVHGSLPHAGLCLHCTFVCTAPPHCWLACVPLSSELCPCTHACQCMHAPHAAALNPSVPSPLLRPPQDSCIAIDLKP